MVCVKFQNLVTFGMTKPDEPWVGFPNNRKYNVNFDYITENFVDVVAQVQ